MDQLHRAHDNGRAANALARTRDITEHRAALVNDVNNTTVAVEEQGASENNNWRLPWPTSAVRPPVPVSKLTPPKDGRRQGRKQFESSLTKKTKKETAARRSPNAHWWRCFFARSQAMGFALKPAREAILEGPRMEKGWKRCQEPFSGLELLRAGSGARFRGRPRGRKVLSKPNFPASIRTQFSSP